MLGSVAMAAAAMGAAFGSTGVDGDVEATPLCCHLEDVTARVVGGEDSLRSVLKAIALSEPFLRKNTLPTSTRKHADHD